MAESSGNFGDGILKGLKKILFTSDPPDPAGEVGTAPQHDSGRQGSGSGGYTYPPGNSTTGSGFQDQTEMKVEGTADAGAGDQVKNMKLRVYQLLESLNRQGIDFFEVWNAAVEMGGPSPANIKSAFTSLRVADKTLTKQRLMDTGNAYMRELQNVFDTESKKRTEERTRLDQEKDQVKRNLEAEISSINQQITALQEKLTARKAELESIPQKYNPRFTEIDAKLAAGRKSVEAVVSEMQQVMEIIRQDLN